VTAIAANGFQNYYGSSIAIPDSVVTVGGNAFAGCIYLTVYTEAASLPSGWDENWNPANRPTVWNCGLSEDGAYVDSFTRIANGVDNPDAAYGVHAPYRDGYVFGGWWTSRDAFISAYGEGGEFVSLSADREFEVSAGESYSFFQWHGKNFKGTVRVKSSQELSEITLKAKRLIFDLTEGSFKTPVFSDPNRSSMVMFSQHGGEVDLMQIFEILGILWPVLEKLKPEWFDNPFEDPWNPQPQESFFVRLRRIEESIAEIRELLELPPMI